MQRLGQDEQSRLLQLASVLEVGVGLGYILGFFR